MKQKDFDRLVASVKQAGTIRRGHLKPGRATDFRPEDVQAIRAWPKKSQRLSTSYVIHDDLQHAFLSRAGKGLGGSFNRKALMDE